MVEILFFIDDDGILMFFGCLVELLLLDWVFSEGFWVFLLVLKEGFWGLWIVLIVVDVEFDDIV